MQAGGRRFDSGWLHYSASNFYKILMRRRSRLSGECGCWLCDLRQRTAADVFGIHGQTRSWAPCSARSSSSIRAVTCRGRHIRCRSSEPADRGRNRRCDRWNPRYGLRRAGARCRDHPASDRAIAGRRVKLTAARLLPGLGFLTGSRRPPGAAAPSEGRDYAGAVVRCESGTISHGTIPPALPIIKQ